MTHRTAPRELAREIVRRSVQSTPSPVGAQHAVPGANTWRDANHPPTSRGDTSSSASAPEKIDAIYLSPDAFARRTDEASIAEQMGDIFVAAGLPRPIPADDDRIGGWMLMYQMLDAGEWLLTENCAELIRTLPNLIRDPARIEDIEKMDGDDACLAAGTLIQCRRGWVPVENVSTNDFVLTRQGWRKVLWSGMTKAVAKRLCVRLSDATQLIATPNHLIWVNGQWSPLDAARYGDTMLRCTRKPSFIEGVAIAAIRALRTVATACTSWPQASAGIAYCTGTSGRMFTDRSLRVITSTTSTATHLTIGLIIWNALRHALTLPSTQNRSNNWLSSARSLWPRLALWQRFGISQKRAVNSRGESRPDSCVCEESAKNAGNVPNPSGGCLGAAFVQTRASRVSGARCVWMTLKNAASAVAGFFDRIATRGYDFAPAYVLGVTEEIPGPVYNIAVEGVPEFFASGILVHNCDAARYGLKSRYGAHRVVGEHRMPLADRIAARVVSGDPTIRAMQARKAQVEESRTTNPVKFPHRRHRHR